MDGHCLVIWPGEKSWDEGWLGVLAVTRESSRVLYLLLMGWLFLSQLWSRSWPQITVVQNHRTVLATTLRYNLQFRCCCISCTLVISRFKRSGDWNVYQCALIFSIGGIYIHLRITTPWWFEYNKSFSWTNLQVCWQLDHLLSFVSSWPKPKK